MRRGLPHRPLGNPERSANSPFPLQMLLHGCVTEAGAKLTVLLNSPLASGCGRARSGALDVFDVAERLAGKPRTATVHRVNVGPDADRRCRQLHPRGNQHGEHTRVHHERCPVRSEDRSIGKSAYSASISRSFGTRMRNTRTKFAADRRVLSYTPGRSQPAHSARSRAGGSRCRSRPLPRHCPARQQDRPAAGARPSRSGSSSPRSFPAARIPPARGSATRRRGRGS